MRVIDIWPTCEGSSSVAIFDLELTPQIRIFGLILKRNTDGDMRVFAPKSGGRHAASFHPEISEEITTAAIAALRGKSRGTAG
jgi:hypothetical protein